MEMSELKGLFKKGEQGLAKSLLKWKLSQEGKTVSGKEEQMDSAAEALVEEAHTIIKRHGGNILKEIKEAAKELKKTGEK